MDKINFFQYLDEPLAYLTVTYTRVSDFISPNAMSLIGVAVAAISARFLAREELKYRQLGVSGHVIYFGVIIFGTILFFRCWCLLSGTTLMLWMAVSFVRGHTAMPVAR